MLDRADLAILETYADRMNPVELGLVQELRRFHDDAESIEKLRAEVEGLEEEISDTKYQLENAQEEIEDLQKLDAAEGRERDHEYARKCVQSELDDLRAKLLGLVAT